MADVARNRFAVCLQESLLAVPRDHLSTSKYPLHNVAHAADPVLATHNWNKSTLPAERLYAPSRGSSLDYGHERRRNDTLVDG